MLQITPQMKVLVAVEPADFRKGIDGLAAVCKASLKQDPFAGTVFVFRNRRATAIKVLVYDGQGFWLCQKRLSEGRFRWWPSKRSADDPLTQAVAAHQIAVLFSGGNPKLRCHVCGKLFTAPAPQGIGDQKYDHTAASMIGLLKYGSGLPFNRLDRLQGNLEIPLPASTQWDIVHGAAESLAPAYKELIRGAAQGQVVPWQRPNTFWNSNA